jgi:hypothetical protein
MRFSKLATRNMAKGMWEVHEYLKATKICDISGKLLSNNVLPC